MTLPPSWIEDRLAGAPPDLKQRILAYASEGSGRDLSPEGLARASRVALTAALSRPARRAAALDLLAADALITLALFAQADHDPETLDAFAIRLMTGDSTRA